jgi:two-component system, LytTR family, sensor kinase
MTRPDPATQPPRLLPGPRIAALVLAAATAMALISFWYRYSDVLTRGGTEPFQVKLIEELTGVFAAVILLVPVVWLARTLGWRGVPWHRQVMLHAPVAALFGGLHTLSLWGSRSVLFPLAGLGSYDYGDMPLRFAMELGIQVPIYLLTVAGALAVEHVRGSRARELRLARLEGELARARLGNLEHQLRPHFLFNALNTVSSVMYEDRDRADRILADLSHFLRRSLRSSEAQEVPLAEELENLELFLGVARARFEDRLEVEVDVGEDVRGAAVPALLLQPLVENALRHGDPGEDHPARIRISARGEDGRLALEVTDNGPGAGEAAGAPAGHGIGLENTRRRLELLHPGEHRFEAGERPEGGFRVRIEIPLRALRESADARSEARAPERPGKPPDPSLLER